MDEREHDIRVMLVDDQPLMREGIATILDAQAEIRVVAQASDGTEAVRTAGRVAVDVVCMDVQMPGMDGLEAARRIIADRSDAPKVLVLTTFAREDYLIEALRVGASGFVLKTTRPEQLADAIRSVAAGDALLSPEVTRSVIRRAVAAESSDAGAPTSSLPEPRTDQPPAGAEPLTAREHEVLRRVAEGLSNEEIAADLMIGRATVKTHVSNVLMKLGLRDRVQAVAYAYRHGLVR